MKHAAGAMLLAQLVCGTKLRGPTTTYNYDPPPANLAKYQWQMNTAAVKISALKIKSVSAANSAQAAAAQARAEKLHIEQMYVQTYQVGPELQAIQKAATSQADSANAASKNTIAVAKQLTKEAKTIPNLAKQLAVEEVKSLLKEKYQQLDDWRNKVLTNPWEKGQVEATKAAQPYFKMMGNFGASIAETNFQAGLMRSAARGDESNSKALSAGIEAKREGGDVIGAAQDQEMAAALETQSNQLMARATALEGNAAQMRTALPGYANAARLAAWNAEYASNPDGIPPPPVDPNFAFVAPPPGAEGPAPAPAPAR